MKQIGWLLSLSLALLLVSPETFSQVSVGVTISAGFAPPELPVYEQPPCPVDGYLWTPGYWAFSEGDYYWVPGVWVDPPVIGYLWTPSYWLFVDGNYHWNRGYWGRHVGFYGGINYGFGYWGTGFCGGRWEGRHFRYNRAAANIGNHFMHHSYEDRTVLRENNRRTSYNGGVGGVERHADKHEQQAFMEQHHASTNDQRNHMKAARSDRGQFVKENHGVPAHAAVKTTKDYRGNMPPKTTSPGRPKPVQMNNPVRPQQETGKRQGGNRQESETGKRQGGKRQESTPPRQQPAPQHSPAPAPQQHQPVRPQQTPQNHPAPAPPRQQPQPQHSPAPAPQQHQQPNRPQGNGSPAQGGRPGQINPGQGRRE